MKTVMSCFVVLSALGTTTLVGQVIYNNSSTAAEGYQRGLSGVISAQGQRNLSNSQAAINLTDARSQQIDNQLKSVNAYWEKKDIYSQHEQQKLGQIEQQRSDYLARHGLGSLTPEEFDRTTGTITWPKVLEQKQYDPYRSKLDELMKKRSYVGALTGDEYVEATTASKQWRTLLAQQKNVYPAPILDQMIKFVLKVNRELDDNLG
jgi:hypothetical protein